MIITYPESSAIYDDKIGESSQHITMKYFSLTAYNLQKLKVDFLET